MKQNIIKKKCDHPPALIPLIIIVSFPALQLVKITVFPSFLFVYKNRGATRVKRYSIV
ncbi:MAG: hypothetical protein ACJ72X_12605 [Nitrososphaeraceae archaeon]